MRLPFTLLCLFSGACLYAQQTTDTLHLPEQEMEEVTVTSTRSKRHIDDIPTRVEVVSGEELAEKAVMQPGNVRMLLSETTGIQTQQTSATSAASSIRIHGLDGRYTLLLKDGFPLYSGFSGGLSVLQVPPLDLKRVELIKGSSSTLYGGGAIAGLVNFISKEPGAKPENSVLFNTNQTGALDASAFHSHRSGRWGTTVYAAYNGQREYDNNDDGLSDIPHFRRFSLNPKIFYYAPHTTWQLGVNGTIEDRKGGDLQVLRGKADAAHQYFEENDSRRWSSQFKVERSFGKNFLTVKNSVASFSRRLQQPGYRFEGDQLSTFTEVALQLPRPLAEWTGGLNLYSDNFRQRRSPAPLDEKQLIAGAFVQNNLKFAKKLSAEAGLRGDYADGHGWLVLPRLSLLYKLSPAVTSRLGGGLGYKLPTVFTENAEERGLRNLAPIGGSVRAETSEGLTWDVNYRTSLSEEVKLSVNQLFFITRLHRPVVLLEGAGGAPAFYANAPGRFLSRGMESNLRLSVEPLSFSIGYSLIDARMDTAGLTTQALLTARHRIYFTSMYEVEEKLRIAFEAFYTGRQYTTPADRKPAYWVMGLSAERRWEHFSLFANAENFTDRRQSRSESLYTGNLLRPEFKPIWAPTEGIIFNGGFRIFF
ncbi:TonB-dependent receptor [Paraflavisolibacter sp. H34]|uniref:TonB-dependent receptor plug domain-containing protein n=1 Tax=Huijunlia imazamoxiresistens TaxID=3127457 RepID=UPI0030175ECD